LVDLGVCIPIVRPLSKRAIDPTPSLAALARGAWPALEGLDLHRTDLSARPNLDDARHKSAALVELRQ
jgi:hypothetical protein